MVDAPEIEREEDRTAIDAANAAASLPKAISSGRGSKITEAGAAFTGYELNSLIASLRKRPAKADLAQALATITSAGLAIAKSLGTKGPGNMWSLGPTEAIFLLIACGAVVVALVRYFGALFADDSDNRRAIAFVVTRLQAQGLPVETETPSVSNWERAQKLFWARVFSVLEIKRQAPVLPGTKSDIPKPPE
jgi:hypothetical protein